MTGCNLLVLFIAASFFSGCSFLPVPLPVSNSKDWQRYYSKKEILAEKNKQISELVNVYKRTVQSSPAWADTAQRLADYGEPVIPYILKLGGERKRNFRITDIRYIFAGIDYFRSFVQTDFKYWGYAEEVISKIRDPKAVPKLQAMSQGKYLLPASKSLWAMRAPLTMHNKKTLLFDVNRSSDSANWNLLMDEIAKSKTEEVSYMLSDYFQPSNITVSYDRGMEKNYVGIENLFSCNLDLQRDAPISIRKAFGLLPLPEQDFNKLMRVIAVYCGSGSERAKVCFNGQAASLEQALLVPNPDNNAYVKMYSDAYLARTEMAKDQIRQLRGAEDKCLKKI